MGLLEDRVAIVTGAGRGLGREEALALAAEGARVVVNDLGVSLAGEVETGDSPAALVVEEIRQAGGTAIANGDDVADWAGAGRLVAQAYDTFGRLDILVNNAGVLRDRMSFNMTEAEFDLVMRVHCKGHYATSHQAVRRWRDAAKATGAAVYGRIINTVSEAGLYGSAGNSNYAMAKAAIAALTQSLAREMGRYGVTSNFMAPRARTRMTLSTPTGSMFEAPAEGFDPWNPAWPAQFVVFLASELAGGINGQGFVSWANEIELVSGWHSTGKVAHAAGAFMARDIPARLDELFGSSPRQPA